MADNLNLIQKQEKDKMAVNSVDNHKGEEAKRSEVTPDEVDQAAFMTMQRKMSTDAFPRKKSSFQITSVSTSLRGRRVERDLTGEDHDIDSLDDLDESHTDDISSSDILDVSKTTDIDPDPASDQDTFHNLTEGGEIAKSDVQNQVQKSEPKNESIPNLQTVSQANLSRFKVVKIESKEPFKRGRWTCLDFLDPHEKGGEGVTKVEDVGSGNSSAASSVHYVPGVDDPSKNPLLEMGANVITESHPIVEPLPVYANQLKDNTVGEYEYANSHQQQLLQDVPPIHHQNMAITSEQNGHMVHNGPDIPHLPASSQSQEYVAQNEYIVSKGQTAQANPNDQVLGVVPNSTLRSVIDPTQPVLESHMHGIQGLRQDGVAASGQDHQAQISLSRLTSPDQQAQLSQPAAIMSVYPGDVSHLPEQLTENYVAEPRTSNHHNLSVNEYAAVTQIQHDYSQGQQLPNEYSQAQYLQSEYSQTQQLPNEYSHTQQNLQGEYSQVQQFQNEYQQTQQLHNMSSEYVAQSLTSDYQNPQLTVTSEYQGAQHVHNPYTLQNDFQTQQHLTGDFQSQTKHFANDFPAHTQQHLPNEYQSHADLGQIQTDPSTSHVSDRQTGSVAVNSTSVDPVRVEAPTNPESEQQPLPAISNAKSSPEDRVQEDANADFQSEDKAVYGSRPDSISVQEKPNDSDNSHARDNVAQTLLTPPLLEMVSATIQPSLASPSREEGSESGASTVAIDNKIEQAMDLVKSHLMYAVREEVEVLKEQIKELIEKNSQLEAENAVLKNAASAETLARLTQLQSKPSHTPTTASS